MKSKLWEFITAFLIGVGFVFFIFIVSGKHQDVKESDLICVDTFEIIGKTINYDQPGKVIYSTENREGWIIYINRSDTMVLGYDKYYICKKK